MSIVLPYVNGYVLNDLQEWNSNLLCDVFCMVTTKWNQFVYFTNLLQRLLTEGIKKFDNCQH